VPSFYVRVGDTEPDGPWVVEWSTVVDAPVTYGMRRDEVEKHHREQYGVDGAVRLPRLMSELDARGISSRGTSRETVLQVNRAGHHEACATEAEIVEWYCRRRADPPEGVGRPLLVEQD
jgi:hypothetical protein